MPTLEDIMARIEEIGGLKTFGAKREIKYLPNILAEDEQIEYLTSGIVDNKRWLITCTNKRIIFLDKGLVYGLKQIETPLEKVNSIEFNTGLFVGKIAIWDGASKMEITDINKKTVQPFVNAINAALNKIRHGMDTVSQSDPDNQSDVITKLEKLAELREKGILTDEEFNSQKEKLLNN